MNKEKEQLNLTFDEKWEIYDKLNEANLLISEHLYKNLNNNDLTELMKIQIALEKIMHNLVFK